MSTIALVDGDTIAWLAAIEAEKTIDWGDTLSRSADLRLAKEIVRDRIEGIKKAIGASKAVVALSDPSRHYWRHDVLPSYKDHRGDPSKRPLALTGVKTWMATIPNVYIRPFLEADDVVGILATSTTIAGPKVVVGNDKDLKQIPGSHFDWTKPEKGVTTITAVEGDRFHLFQTLTGDTVDGFGGCPGVGPKKAEKILGDTPEWSLVEAAFVKAGLTVEDALRQARVARILRADDWDFKNKKVRLWTPR